MKHTIKIFAVVAALLVTAFILPSIALASNEVTLTAAGGDGYIRLHWDTSVNAKVYNVYKGTSPGFSANESSLIVKVYKTNEFDDYNVEADTTYYYKISAIDAIYGTTLSNEVSAVPNVRQPHGFYDNKTTKCSVCHSGHEGKAGSLINTELTTAEDLCKICHEASGVSSLIIEAPPAGSKTTNCISCHNPHGNNSNQKFVPMLLQVTLEGNVVFEAANPENGVGKAFCLASGCHDDLTYDPPTEGDAHDSMSIVDEQGINNTTKISCNACHQKHGSDAEMLLRKEIKWNNKSYLFEVAGSDLYQIFNNQNPIVANYNDFCQSCHEDKMDTLKGFPGKVSYNDADKNVHADVACYGCHDPHGVGNRKYLKGTYLTDFSSSGSITSNFALCFSCHESSVLTSTYDITTKFSGTYGGESINLHVYHLKNVDGNNNYQVDTAKLAVCKDCHSPHGPATAKNVSFPSQYKTSTYLSVYDSPTGKPEYTNISPGGSCNLICHNAKHADSVYTSVYQ